MIAGGLHPDHAAIARFQARHETALGGLFSQVLRLLAAEGVVSLGLLSLDGTKVAGSAAQKANRTLPRIEKIMAEAAVADAAEDAREGGSPQPATPRTLARRAERRERLARARDRLAARDKARREAQRAKQEAWEAAAAAEKRRGHGPGDEPRASRAGTEPRANITDPDVRVMRKELTTMSRRGFTACESEWLLACAAHNLRKLHRHRTAGDDQGPDPSSRSLGSPGLRAPVRVRVGDPRAVPTHGFMRQAALCIGASSEAVRFCCMSSAFDQSLLTCQLRHAGAQAVDVPVGRPEGEPGPGAV